MADLSAPGADPDRVQTNNDAARRFAPAGLAGTTWHRPEVGDTWVFRENGVVTAGTSHGTWKQVDRRTIGVSLRSYYAVTFESDRLAHARTNDLDDNVLNYAHI